MLRINGDKWGRGKIYNWPTAHCQLGRACAVEFVYPLVLGMRKEFKPNRFGTVAPINLPLKQYGKV